MSERSREEVLQSLFSAHPLRAVIVDNARYCGRWFDREPQSQRGQFHLIGEGECWVSGPSLPQAVQLSAGDLIVFPLGSPHVLSGSPPGSHKGGEDHFTSMLCGELDFSAAPRNPILAALPPCFVVHARDGGQAFKQIASLLLSTARSGVFGQQIILDKLADSLFVMAVCAYAESSTDRRGLLAALADARLARALAALHREPGRAWTVESLAGVAAMSRTAFALAFSAALDTSPFQYLTEWRISEAKRLLQDRRQSVAQVAERLGYQSEAAFRRAFKRIEGVGPGQLRKP